ncbi:MAG TPA: SIMPL domain-containing protein [Anaerolineae bacterium]
MSHVKNSKWYFVMGGLTVLAIAAGVIVSAIPAASAGSRSNQTTEGSLPRTITVVGAGSASAVPDVATAQIGVDTQSASPEEATRLNDEKLAAILEALQTAGIDAQDIQTTYYSLYAEQRYDPGTNQPTGEFTYRVSSGLSVKIRDLAKVGSILSDVVKAGANNISGVSFSIEETQVLEATAREKAVADAKARAESLAQLNGVELGEVAAISEVITGIPGPIVYERAALGLGGGGAPIQPGQLEVTMQVQVSFAIQ